MALDPATLDAPFAALQAYDWGADAGPLAAIDAAVVAAHDDKALRDEVEKRLIAVLTGKTSRAAREYACRKLMLVGGAASVPALAALLGDAAQSHMARFALERNAAPQAGEALRQAAARLQGDLRIGMISSLAGRGDTAAVAMLAGLLTGEPKTAAAAADALGRIYSPEAIAARAGSGVKDAAVAAAIVDARLASAERLLAQGKRAEAQAIYKAIESAADGQSPAARSAKLAAARGVLACLDTSTAS
ncbi:MAG: hypothetical protein ACKOTB_06305 [Planctomycetia bacterium]